MGALIDEDDQEAYSRGLLHKKTLQPKEKHLEKFDLQRFLKDWKENCISDSSFRCSDISFFDDNAEFWKNEK